MLKESMGSKNNFSSLVFILSLSALILGGGFTARLSFAETPEEKAQKEADKKAAEAKKKLEEMHKKAADSVEYHFDKFKASTQISARNEKVRSQSEVFAMYGDLFLWPYATVSGEVKKETNPAAPPEKIQLLFWAKAQNRRTLLYRGTQELDLLVDGKPLGPYAVQYTVGRDGDEFLENMETEMSYNDFYKMVHAKQTMEGRLGQMEFKFNDYQKILYSTYLDRISPGAK